MDRATEDLVLDDHALALVHWLHLDHDLRELAVAACLAHQPAFAIGMIE